MAGYVERSRGAPGTSNRFAVWGGAAALMALPVAGLRAVEDGAADPGDYVFLLILLSGVGLAWELSARAPDRLTYRLGFCYGAAAAFLTTWMNLAVGIIGSEDDPANWIYAAVVAVAALGTLLSGLRPGGMALAMTAAAAAQVLAFAAALVAGLGFTGPITVFFTALWLISASLFRRAARSGV